VILEVFAREVAKWIEQLRDICGGAVQILQIACGRLDLGQHPQLSEVIVEVLVEEIEALHSETQIQPAFLTGFRGEGGEVTRPAGFST